MSRCSVSGACRVSVSARPVLALNVLLVSSLLVAVAGNEAAALAEVKVAPVEGKVPVEAINIISNSHKAEGTPISIQTNDPSLALNRFTFNGNVLPVPGSGNYRVENWIVAYCLDWFQPCTDLAPMWSTLSSEWQSKLNNALLTHEVRFARVDCAVDKVLCNEQNVQGYPSIQRFHKGKNIASITGFRSAADMKTRLPKWLNTNLAPEDGDILSAWMAALKQAVERCLEKPAAKGSITVLLALGAMSLTIRLAGAPQVDEKTASPILHMFVESEQVDAAAPSEQLDTAASFSWATTTRSGLQRSLPEDWAVPVCSSMEL